MKRFLIIIFLLCGSFVNAQLPQITSTRNMFWGAASVNIKFSKQWMLVSDGLYRIEYTDGDVFQIGIRAGGRYTTAKGWQLTAGGVLFEHYPNPNGVVPRPELRGWQEAGRRWDIGIHHIVYPRIRFEQRFFREYHGTELEENFTLNTLRLRIRGEYFYGIGPKGNQHWSIVAGDEIMFHSRPSGFTSLDQNRAWIGPQYRFSENFTAQLTYLNIFQQRSSAKADQLHAIRLSLQFSIDFTTKDDSSPK